MGVDSDDVTGTDMNPATMNARGTGTPGRETGVVVALLTPPGRGALAVVGVAGADAAPMVDAVFTTRGGLTVAGRAEGAIAFGRWGGASGEEVVVVRHAAERLEVHCHGGLAAAAAIVASLVGRGAREIGWQEWLVDVDHDAGPVVAEAREALPLAGGPKAARILCWQLAGALDAEIRRIERIIAAGETDVGRTAVERLLRASRVGLRLTRPWRVVVAGNVNTGKSSLVNALAGHARALVSPVPGTTRDLVETRIVLDGWEVDLVDTAGIREQPAGAAEAAGIARAVATAATADLVLRVVPATEAQAAVAVGSRELLVLSKTDLAPPARRAAVGAIRTSAATGAGIGELARGIVAAVVPEETIEPDLLGGAVPFTPRQVEVVRGLGAWGAG
jgi:tRNA modification GTPase